MENLDMDCPPYVFQVPPGIPYRVGDGATAYDYNPKRVITLSSNFCIVDHLRISHFLFPKGRIQDYNKIKGLKLQLEKLDQLKEPPPRSSQDHGSPMNRPVSWFFSLDSQLEFYTFVS